MAVFWVLQQFNSPPSLQLFQSGGGGRREVVRGWVSQRERERGRQCGMPSLIVTNCGLNTLTGGSNLWTNSLKHYLLFFHLQFTQWRGQRGFSVSFLAVCSINEHACSRFLICLHKSRWRNESLKCLKFSACHTWLLYGKLGYVKARFNKYIIGSGNHFRQARLYKLVRFLDYGRKTARLWLVQKGQIIHFEKEKLLTAGQGSVSGRRRELASNY